MCDVYMQVTFPGISPCPTVPCILTGDRGDRHLIPKQFPINGQAIKELPSELGEALFLPSDDRFTPQPLHWTFLSLSVSEGGLRH